MTKGQEAYYLPLSFSRKLVTLKNVEVNLVKKLSLIDVFHLRL